MATHRQYACLLVLMCRRMIHDDTQVVRMSVSVDVQEIHGHTQVVRMSVSVDVQEDDS